MIIGISGKIKSGKSTVCKNLIRELPYYKQIAFGDFLKEECSALFNYPLEWNYSQEGKNKRVQHRFLPYGNLLVREILQWWGTDVMRKAQPDRWVGFMRERIKFNNYEDVIIEDVRFENEAMMIKEFEGILIRINTHEGYEYTEFSNHESETALDNFTKWDYVANPEFGKLNVVSEHILGNFNLRR